MNATKKPSIGFIGLGLMGTPMAQHIHTVGFPLTVFNRDQHKTVSFAKQHIRVAPTPAALAKGVDIIITMVTDEASVRQVLFGPEGAVEQAKNGSVVIDMSTIGPLAAISISKKLKAYGLAFVDAPVTGSLPAAKSRTLTIFCGGEKETVERVQPVLAAVGTTIHHVGPVGHGQAVKLINNMIIAISITSLAEAIRLGEQMGLPRQTMADILETIPALSPFMKMKMKNFITGEFPLFFTARNMKKDVSLAQEEARAHHLSLPLLKTVEKMYQNMIDLGLADNDMSEIIKTITTEG